MKNDRQQREKLALSGLSRQHFVSQVLLRRFKAHGQPLHCFNIDSGEWKLKSIERTFSAKGWNQLISCGVADDTLEAAFSKVESAMPQVFDSLDKAAKAPSTDLSQHIYEALCWYCAFLRNASPFAKAAAAAGFVMQVNSELQQGKGDSLRDVLNAPNEVIQQCLAAHSSGQRLIIDSEDYLQLIYRVQFRRSYAYDFSKFRHSVQWGICNSPIELPLSDMALVDIPTNDRTLVYYILPIAPNLLLKGVIKCGPQTPSANTTVRSEGLPVSEAGEWLEVICASAVRELVCSTRDYDIPAIRAQAHARGVRFHRIAQSEAVFRTGLSSPSERFGIRFVSKREWVNFIHGHVLPPSPNSAEQAKV